MLEANDRFATANPYGRDARNKPKMKKIAIR